MSVDAVVLAGGVNRVELYDGYVPGYKSLLPIGGKLSVQYTIDALRGSGCIGRIALVGPPELRTALESLYGEVLEYVPGGDSLLASFTKGLGHFAGSRHVLVTTADIPLIKAETVADFLAACTANGFVDESMQLLCVPHAAFTGELAGSAKGFNRFRDAAICHGSLFLADPRILDNAPAMRRIDPLYDARKNPLGAALAVGLRVGLSYIVGVHLLHALSLARMAKIASLRFGIRFIPVLLDLPEAAIDIDNPEDYALVTGLLDRRTAAPVESANG
jgi:CTP:molybdopterin cytidylyltransferase MocA